MTAPKKIENPSESHVRDMEIISKRLWQGKRELSLCGEFETALDRMNRSLRVELPPPAPSIRMNVTVTYGFDMPYGEGTPREQRDAIYREWLNFVRNSTPEELAARLAGHNAEHSKGYTEISATVHNAPRS